MFFLSPVLIFPVGGRVAAACISASQPGAAALLLHCSPRRAAAVTTQDKYENGDMINRLYMDGIMRNQLKLLRLLLNYQDQ